MSMLEQRTQLLGKIYRHAQSEIESGDIWSADQHVFPAFNSPDTRELSAALRGKSFQRIIEERRKRGLSTHVLELFGSGQLFDDPSVADTITGVRLTDKIYPGLTRARPPHHSVLEGNLHDQKTWDELSKHMENNSIPAFDLVVCAPFYGWKIYGEQYPLPVLLDVFYPLLQNTYSLLSSNGGTLYTEIPIDMHVWWRDAKVWEWRMTRNKINTEISNRFGFPYDTPTYVKITRNLDSPGAIVPIKGRFKIPEE